MTLDRRRLLEHALSGAGLLALAATAGLPLTAGPAAAQTVEQAKLMAPEASPLPVQALGDPKAPVTIIEYASATCSHCADFYVKTFPTLKKTYIDTGKVHFIFREFPFEPVATAAFMLARCMPPDKYEAMIGTLFETQRAWAFGGDPAAGLLTIAKQAGMSQDEFEKCLSDKDLAEKIQESARYGNQELGINATPTFFINGKKVSGALSAEEFAKEIDPLLAGK